MKAILAPLLLAGCVTSIVSGPTRIRIGSNVRGFAVTAPGLRVDIAEVNNSTPTAASLRGATRLASTLGATLLPIVVPGTATTKAVLAIPTAIPQFRNEPTDLRP